MPCYRIETARLLAGPSAGNRFWNLALYRRCGAPSRSCGTRLLLSRENYGTEEIVGEAIRGHRREVFLATKAAPRNFRRSDLIHAAENSLRRLGTDYIDLYQLHWPNLTIPIEETMRAMEGLVDSGKIRFIGVSNFDVGSLPRAQRSLSKHKIVSNQVRYSLIDRTIERKSLPYCRHNALTIIAFSPLGLDFQSCSAPILPVFLRKLRVPSEEPRRRSL